MLLRVSHHLVKEGMRANTHQYGNKLLESRTLLDLFAHFLHSHLISDFLGPILTTGTYRRKMPRKKKYHLQGSNLRPSRE